MSIYTIEHHCFLPLLLLFGLASLHSIMCTCSQILKEDDTPWPQPDKVGRQVSSFIFTKLSSERCNFMKVSLNILFY